MDSAKAQQRAYMINRPQVFIEKIMPVKLLNQQVYYEHGGNPFKGLHRWYSRKPLSFSRACVLGSILPADISLEEFEYLLGLYTEQELELWQNSKLSDEEKEERSEQVLFLSLTHNLCVGCFCWVCLRFCTCFFMCL